MWDCDVRNQCNKKNFFVGQGMKISCKFTWSKIIKMSFWITWWNLLWLEKVLQTVGLGKQNPQQVTMLQNAEKSFLSNMVELALAYLQLNIDWKLLKRFRLTNVKLANLSLFLLCIFNENKKVCEKSHQNGENPSP